MKTVESTRQMRFATVPIATGLLLHYAEHGDPHGEPIVFLHGWPDSGFSFSRVLPLLPEPLHAFAPDQRFGDSDRPASGYAISDMGADVVAFLDAVGITRVTLVGHSHGSFVARQVAIAHPERVSALVLIGTGFSTTNQVTEDPWSLRDLPEPIRSNCPRLSGRHRLPTASSRPLSGSSPRA